MIHPVKGCSVVSEAEVSTSTTIYFYFFWNSLAFPMIQQLLAIWPLVPLSFLNIPCTSGSSLFLYCWSLAWKDFAHYLASIWNECSYLNILWHCPSLELEWKLTFSVFRTCIKLDTTESFPSLFPTTVCKPAFLLGGSTRCLWKYYLPIVSMLISHIHSS